MVCAAQAPPTPACECLKQTQYVLQRSRQPPRTHRRARARALHVSPAVETNDAAGRGHA